MPTLCGACSPHFSLLRSKAPLHSPQSTVHTQQKQQQQRRRESKARAEAGGAAAMEALRTARALLASFVLAALAAHALVAMVESRASPTEKTTTQGDEVKKPDCVPGMDPRTFPGIGGHGGGIITPVTPSHGGGTTLPSPSFPLPSPPSHGGGGGFGSSPTTSPFPGGGSGSPSSPGGGFGSSPSIGGGSPSHGGGGAYGGSPSTPGGGAYGGSPSTPGGGAYGSGSPSTPVGGGGAYGGGSPSHGGSGSGIGTSSPTPFVSVDPHSFGSLPGTCDYWRSHPMEIWSAIGARFPSTSSSSSTTGATTMGHFFGGAAAGSVGGSSDVSIQDALANTRTDGTGALLREGAAALLNSMTRAGFPYTTDQVRDAFAKAAAAAAGSDDGGAAAAAQQAEAFKKANEGKA